MNAVATIAAKMSAKERIRAAKVRIPKTVGAEMDRGPERRSAPTPVPDVKPRRGYSSCEDGRAAMARPVDLDRLGPGAGLELGIANEASADRDPRCLVVVAKAPLDRRRGEVPGLVRARAAVVRRSAEGAGGAVVEAAEGTALRVGLDGPADLDLHAVERGRKGNTRRGCEVKRHDALIGVRDLREADHEGAVVVVR